MVGFKYKSIVCRMDEMWPQIRNNEKIVLYTSTDAYDRNFVRTQQSGKYWEAGYYQKIWRR